MIHLKTTDQEIILSIYKISRLVRKHVSDISHTDVEPSMLQLQLLTNLCHGPHSMTQIAEQLYVKLPTASSLVDRLIEVQYIKRVNDKADRRITKIDLTEKGKHILTVTMKIKMKKMKFILDKLTSTEKKSIFSIMENLYKKLEMHS